MFGIDNPVHSSLIFHNQAAFSSFLAAEFVFASVQSLKYFPVVFSSSGSMARQIDVWAPDIAVLKKILSAGLTNILGNFYNDKLLFLEMFSIKNFFDMQSSSKNNKNEL